MLLHLSDVHVTDPDAPIARFADGEHLLRLVVDHVIDADVPLDGVVVTGDLVDVGTADEYRRLLTQLDRLPCPWYPLPGNHDRRPELDAVLARAGVASELDTAVTYVVDVGAARLVVVDSAVIGHHDGGWDPERLDWLDRTLTAAPETPTLVATHHPPVSTALWPMDYGGGHGGAGLAEVIERHHQVDAVICGHVHRRLVLRWAGTILSCAPSLTFGIEALWGDDDEPMLHTALPTIPLYRWVDSRLMIDSLDWHPDRPRLPMRLALGDGWADYERAARRGVLPRDPDGH